MGNDYPSMAVSQSGEITVRASALGSCYRALVAEGLGYVAEPVAVYMQKVFNSGHERENVILGRLQKEHKIRFLAAPEANENGQHQFTWQVIDGVYLRGSMDGIGVYKGKTYVVEVKTASEESFRYFEKNHLSKPKIANYPWQVSAYYHATKKVIPELAGILYAVQMKKDLGDVKTDPILVFLLEPPYSVEDIEAKLMIIQTYYNMSKADVDNTNALPPCSGEGWCQFRYLHDLDQDEDSEEREILDPDLAKYVELDEQKKIIDAEMKGIREIIIDRYKDDPRREKGLFSAGYKFSLVKVESKVFDKNTAIDKLREIGEDVETYFSTSAPYYRFTPVKVRVKNEIGIEIDNGKVIDNV